MLSSLLLVKALFALCAVALPSATERPEQRSDAAPKSHLVQRESDASAVRLSKNWAGAVINSPAVSAHIVLVPCSPANYTCKLSRARTRLSPVQSQCLPLALRRVLPAAHTRRRSGLALMVTPATRQSYRLVSTWCGPTAPCLTAVWLSFVSASADTRSPPRIAAWWEWHPNSGGFFDDISGSISTGDKLRFTVTAAGLHGGTAVVENLSKGTKETETLSNMSSALCQQDAEWIVEDPGLNGGFIPFADFNAVTFTNASAGGAAGTVAAGKAQAMDIEQSGEVITSVSVGTSSVEISYV